MYLTGVVTAFSAVSPAVPVEITIIDGISTFVDQKPDFVAGEIHATTCAVIYDIIHAVTKWIWQSVGICDSRRLHPSIARAKIDTNVFDIHLPYIYH